MWLCWKYEKRTGGPQPAKYTRRMPKALVESDKDSEGMKIGDVVLLVADGVPAFLL